MSNPNDRHHRACVRNDDVAYPQRFDLDLSFGREYSTTFGIAGWSDERPSVYAKV
jgi:hypothetical protein